MGRRCLILALTALLLTGCAGSPGQSAAALALSLIHISEPTRPIG